MDLAELSQMNEVQAREYLEKLRWADGPVCHRCGDTDVVKIGGKAARPGVYRCRGCRKQLTVTTGTIFESSHIPLRKWLMAFHLICSSKKGASALQIKRQLGLGSYETAWHMCHRIRHAMKHGPLGLMLEGEIECDETFVGGKARNAHQGRVDGWKKRKKYIPPKTPVVALVQRDGFVRTRVVASVNSDNLRRAVRDHVKQGSTLYTDELHFYRKAGRDIGAKHEAVNHSKGEYVRGRASTNSVESFFGLLKRGIMGSFHNVSPKHLQRYCDEFAFRWNYRRVDDTDRREAALMLMEGVRLTYNEVKATRPPA